MRVPPIVASSTVLFENGRGSIEIEPEFWVVIEEMKTDRCTGVDVRSDGFAVDRFIAVSFCQACCCAWSEVVVEEEEEEETHIHGVKYMG